MNKREKLVEATKLALQGKLTEDENSKYDYYEELDSNSTDPEDYIFAAYNNTLEEFEEELGSWTGYDYGYEYWMEAYGYTKSEAKKYDKDLYNEIQKRIKDGYYNELLEIEESKIIKTESSDYSVDERYKYLDGEKFQRQYLDLLEFAKKYNFYQPRLDAACTYKGNIEHNDHGRINIYFDIDTADGRWTAISGYIDYDNICIGSPVSTNICDKNYIDKLTEIYNILNK